MSYYEQFKNFTANSGL